MKLLCLLLAVLVLALSVKPCCTDGGCAGIAKEKQGQKALKAAKETECPGCSPFYSCGSCTGFTIAGSFVYSQPLFAQPIAGTATHYMQPCHPQVAPSIWQPPQLS